MKLSNRLSFPASNRSSLFLLSVTTLVFEINLTRLFSVSQFYHFAFMIVSLALLGTGASGTFLVLFPPKEGNVDASLRKISFGTLASILSAYLVINELPFDSFTISWDSNQIGYLALNFLALMLPFFFTGMAVGLLLRVFSEQAENVYAVNLVGAAIGCVLALLAPPILGGEGTVVLSACLAAAAALFPLRTHKRSFSQILLRGISLIALILGLFEMNAMLLNPSTSFFPVLKLSPYKSLSYALQYPDSEFVSQEWNSFSRVDIVSSSSIRSLPGISIQYFSPPPAEHGLFIDGDHLNPIVLAGSDLGFTSYLPAALGYQLIPDAKTLILEPRGGLDVLVALNEGADEITLVEENQLIIERIPQIYQSADITVNNELGRSYLRRSKEQFDLIILSLVHSYYPVGSGAYSLGENYSYTVEAFQDVLDRLSPDGIFVFSRWLQMPPSEWLRGFILAATALESQGRDPSLQIVAIRSFNTGILFVKNSPFTKPELDSVRSFASQRAFDLVYLPDIQPEEVNQYAILQEPVYYQMFSGFMAADSKGDWLANYSYDVSPPTDNHPFFGHYFKWSQAGQILSELGKTWQPFGGAGYLVVLILLALTLSLSIILIFLPLIIGSRFTARTIFAPIRRSGVWSSIAYFSLIGFAYLFIEIPFFQNLILFLGQPTYALTIVLFSILLFSGIGSQYSRRFDHQKAIFVLVVMVFLVLLLLPGIVNLSLGFSFIVRVIITILVLAPLGFLMGMPFPGGIRIIESKVPELIPWVWGINGSASVLSSILSMLLALSFGFRAVIVIGAVCYMGAWFFVPRLRLLG